MSIEYPCVHWDKGKCKKFSDDKITSWCVLSPCASQTPTNADRIRSMSDEELAEQLGLMTTICEFCAKQKNCEDTQDYNCCMEGIFKWLQQPVEENE